MMCERLQVTRGKQGGGQPGGGSPVHGLSTSLFPVLAAGQKSPH
jgi:hypothetical protein